MYREQRVPGAVVRWTAALALCVWNTDPVFAAVPFLAQGAAGLVAPPLKEAAKPAKSAETPPAPAAEPPAAPPVETSTGLMKYAPGYALVAVLVGLGTFIASVPKLSAVAQAGAGEAKGQKR